MIEKYVKGVQSTGTIATLKHFVANNTDFFRRSNSIIDERTLHEIYLPPFKAGIDAGGILPLKKDTKTILLTGEYVEKLAMGGGSAAVKGYNNRFMLDELKKEFGEKIDYVTNPIPGQIRAAEIVLCSIGSDDCEG